MTPLRALALKVLEQTRPESAGFVPTLVPCSRPYRGGTVEQTAESRRKPSVSCSKGVEQKKQGWNKSNAKSLESKEWEAGLAALCTKSCPPAYTPERWRQIVDDAGNFLKVWGRQASELGWQTLELFGVDPVAPDWRLDDMGLIPLLDGRRVALLTADSAAIDAKDYTAMTFFRRNVASGGIPLWELGAQQND